VCARAGWSLPDFAVACTDGGATLLQIRAKHAPSRLFLADADAIVGRADRFGATVIVNDRADIARLSGAQGVHVGQDDLSPVDVRTVLAAGAIVGLSTHSAAQLAESVQQPVDYVAVGPVFATLTKDTGYSDVGLELVRHAAEIAGERHMPVVAIGGITLERAADLVTAGAASVAVITDLLTTNDPTTRVRAFLDRLSRV
jgi:thiamine-phosphate pyrophosphorylase